MQGHAGQFSMDWNGDKLASYSILALNHSAAAFNTSWTLRTKFIGNCTDQDQHCALETSFIPGAQIVWPGTCDDRIYKTVAMKRPSGVCNAESVLEAPLDYPVCGYRGVLCPEKASEVAPPTFNLLTLITIVIGVLLIGSTSIGYIIRTRNRRLAKKGILGTDEKETKTQKRSTLGNR